MQFWALIVDSFREAIDRKIFWIMAGITLIAAFIMACISFDSTGVDFFFGAWRLDWSSVMCAGRDNYPGELSACMASASVRHAVEEFRRIFTVGIIVQCADWIAGGVGMILALIGTAGFFPSFLEGGAVNVVLAKPISRPMIFLAKYVGTMAFVLLQAAWFVGLTFLVAGLRWGMWIPGYLWCIPLMVLLFSYLYCISALVGVKTRSTVAAILISIGAWVVFFGVQGLADLTEITPSLKNNHTLVTISQTAKWIVPKTADITYLATTWSGGGNSGTFIPPAPGDKNSQLYENAKKLEDDRLKLNPWASIGSSLAVEAVFVLWAMWSFHRKDF